MCIDGTEDTRTQDGDGCATCQAPSWVHNGGYHHPSQLTSLGADRAGFINMGIAMITTENLP